LEANVDDLKDRLEGLERKAKIAEDFCVMGRILSDLDDETSAVLQRVLGSSASTRSIWLELRASGFAVDRGLVATHRQGKCVCPKGDPE
jgi:hypothetical protein